MNCSQLNSAQDGAQIRGPGLQTNPAGRILSAALRKRSPAGRPRKPDGPEAGSHLGGVAVDGRRLLDRPARPLDHRLRRQAGAGRT